MEQLQKNDWIPNTNPKKCLQNPKMNNRLNLLCIRYDNGINNIIQ